MGTWVNWAKKVPQIRGGRKLQFFRFFKKFSKIKKIIIFSGQDKFSHLDGEWAHERIEPKKFHQSAVGENFNIFDFFLKFSKMKKILIFSLQNH